MRFVYLHGFASGARSRKARMFVGALGERGVDMAVPSLDGGSFSDMTITSQLAVVEKCIAGAPTVLVGSSMGGYLAALYAARHPEVARLVLLAPAFDFAGAWDARWPIDASGGKLPSIDVYHYSEGSLRSIGYGLIRDALRFPAYPAFSQPALIFHGKGDIVVPIENSRRLAAGLPNIRLV